MAIYEYECECCGECFEQLVFAGDDPKVKCPQCGKSKVRKLVSCAGFLGDSLSGKCGSGASSGFS